MSNRTESRRATCVALVEHALGQVFPFFARRVGIGEARKIAKAVGSEYEIVVGKTHHGAWAHIESRPGGRVVLARRVPRFVVLHEIAHARLMGTRTTDHGLRFLETYVDVTWDYFKDKRLCRALEAALSVAR